VSRSTSEFYRTPPPNPNASFWAKLLRVTDPRSGENTPQAFVTKQVFGPMGIPFILVMLEKRKASFNFPPIQTFSRQQFLDFIPVQRGGKFLFAADGGPDDFAFAILQGEDFFLHRVARD
jgi:hypothetical protein